MDASILAKIPAAAVALAYLDAKHVVAPDLHKAKALAYATIATKRANWIDRNSIYYIFENQVKKRPNDPCYVCEGKTWTWRETEIIVRKIAHYFLSKGINRGDVVALYVSNKPAYAFLWLGFLYIDVIPAFINYNLTDRGLLHCIKVSGAKYILFDAELEKFIADVSDGLRELGSVPLRWRDEYSFAGNPEKPGSATVPAETVDDAVLAVQSVEEIPHVRRAGITWAHPACLVYTSGTTGLPKAASCSHGRIATASRIWTGINSFKPKDRIYTPMPLYHSTAAFLAVAAAWAGGSAVIIGRKFSATRYWDEVRQNDATVIQYVGEVCRYLLSTPPSPKDKEHRVRMAYGNGMRPDVWNRFRERFGVRTISEFFASTEGNGSLFNVNLNEFGAGAVGQTGTLQNTFRKYDQIIVKMDPVTEEPFRNEKGFCEPAEPNENGELITMIDKTSAFKQFTGYHGNDEATKKKILNDVFKKGDTYFRTGDLLRKDSDGYIYFGDRMGDTFRWRSENVSTMQVAAVMGEILDEANVYGVLVPKHDGRAGCAAIPADTKITPELLEKLAVHVRKGLPKYAVPLFLRIVPELEKTGTAKQTKVVLRNEGVDPDKVRDPIYWLQGNRYVPFTKEDWEVINSGKVKL